jgi:hypothetical protein
MILSALLSLIAVLCHAEAALPIGVNLPILGGKDLGGTSVNWTPTATYVFIDLYKHCTPMYIREVSSCD